ncbi:unnamed protein product, partial [Notodromas monacha]
WRSVTWFVETWQFHENAPDCTKAEEVGSERPLKVLLVRFGQWRNNRTEYLCPRKRHHGTRGIQAFRVEKRKSDTKHWPFFLFALVTLSLCWMANPCDAMPKHHPMRHRFTKIRRHGMQRQPARADKATRCTHYDHDYLLVHRDNALVASSRASSRVKANGNLELRQCALSADCNTSGMHP